MKTFIKKAIVFCSIASMVCAQPAQAGWVPSWLSYSSAKEYVTQTLPTNVKRNVKKFVSSPVSFIKEKWNAPQKTQRIINRTLLTTNAIGLTSLAACVVAKKTGLWDRIAKSSLAKKVSRTWNKFFGKKTSIQANTNPQQNDTEKENPSNHLDLTGISNPNMLNKYNGILEETSQIVSNSLKSEEIETFKKPKKCIKTVKQKLQKIVDQHNQSNHPNATNRQAKKISHNNVKTTNDIYKKYMNSQQQAYQEQQNAELRLVIAKINNHKKLPMIQNNQKIKKAIDSNLQQAHETLQRLAQINVFMGPAEFKAEIKKIVDTHNNLLKEAAIIQKNIHITITDLQSLTKTKNNLDTCENLQSVHQAKKQHELNTNVLNLQNLTKTKNDLDACENLQSVHQVKKQQKLNNTITDLQSLTKTKNDLDACENLQSVHQAKKQQKLNNTITVLQSLTKTKNNLDACENLQSVHQVKKQQKLNNTITDLQSLTKTKNNLDACENLQSVHQAKKQQELNNTITDLQSLTKTKNNLDACENLQSVHQVKKQQELNENVLNLQNLFKAKKATKKHKDQLKNNAEDLYSDSDDEENEKTSNCKNVNEIDENDDWEKFCMGANDEFENISSIKETTLPLEELKKLSPYTTQINSYKKLEKDKKYTAIPEDELYTSVQRGFANLYKVLNGETIEAKTQEEYMTQILDTMRALQVKAIEEGLTEGGPEECAFILEDHDQKLKQWLIDDYKNFIDKDNGIIADDKKLYIYPRISSHLKQVKKQKNWWVFNLPLVKHIFKIPGLKKIKEAFAHPTHWGIDVRLTSNPEESQPLLLTNKRTLLLIDYKQDGKNYLYIKPENYGLNDGFAQHAKEFIEAQARKIGWIQKALALESDDSAANNKERMPKDIKELYKKLTNTIKSIKMSDAKSIKEALDNAWSIVNSTKINENEKKYAKTFILSLENLYENPKDRIGNEISLTKQKLIPWAEYYGKETKNAQNIRSCLSTLSFIRNNIVKLKKSKNLNLTDDQKINIEKTIKQKMLLFNKSFTNAKKNNKVFLQNHNYTKKYLEKTAKICSYISTGKISTNEIIKGDILSRARQIELLKSINKNQSPDSPTLGKSVLITGNTNNAQIKSQYF